MPRIEFVLKRLSLTSTREDLRTVAYALGEWLVARDEPPLSASYDRLRELRGKAAAESAARASFDALTNLLEGYFASAESVRRIERLLHEVGREAVWRGVMQALANGPVNQEQLCTSLGRAKSTVSVACEDLRQRELIELVPNESRRENVHALTSLGTQVLARVRADGALQPRVDDAVAIAPTPPPVAVPAPVPVRAQAASTRPTRPQAPAAGRPSRRVSG